MIIQRYSSVFLYGFLIFSVVLQSCHSDNTTSEQESMLIENSKKYTTPVAAIKPMEFVNHDDIRIDNYYWLRERENPEVIEYLQAENNYLDSVMAHTKPFQEKLFEEIKGRIKEKDESVPYFSNGYWYYTRYEEGKEYPIFCRKAQSLDNQEDILLDVNIMAKGHEYYQVGGLSVSLDNKWLSYGVDTVSRRLYTIHFKNLETGEILEDVIPGCTSYAAWAADNKTVFYNLKDPQTLRTFQIKRHEVGTPIGSDKIVFTEDDDTFYTYVYRTKSDKYIVIGSSATLTSDYWILPADNPTGTFTSFTPRTRGHEYNISHFENEWYIVSNKDALNFRLMKTSDQATNVENWTEEIPHRPDVLLESIEIFKNYMVIDERKAGITNIRIRPFSGEEHYIDFGEDAYVAGTGANPEFDTDWVRIGFSSMTTPTTTYDYNMKTHEMVVKKQQEVLGGFDKKNYESARIYIESRDGVQIPVSLVWHVDTKRNGQAPLMLYGYGSYGYSLDPSFSSARLSLLDRGFIYAIAHIRGGQEMGRQWYDDGKLLKKKNTFYDFIDVADGLLAQNYTQKDRLFASGGSAGGLLMGAVVNMRPDLWRGIHAAVPFVDVINTMLDESIPLTTGEYDEWGNPNDKTYYTYIKSYSPYDQVEAKDYPAMLVTTGLHDSQVQYWEPAKWVAKLRALKTNDQPLLLHTNMSTGHGGASGRFKRYKEIAMEYAFFLDIMGITE